MPEYIWGVIQLIKAKDPLDEDIFFMNSHLEKIAEDAKTYDRDCVRRWSEEIFTRIAKGKLAWADSYEIDRLQSQFSHDRTVQSRPSARVDKWDKDSLLFVLFGQQM